jgi:MerR family redox-sensitive transcriptional activator SoxR
LRSSDDESKQAKPAISRELTVGDVARRSGVAVSTLHFYESEGSFRVGVNRGNQRRYSRAVLRQIAVIKVAQSTGVPLSAIRDALTIAAQQRTPTAGTGRGCPRNGVPISTSASTG